MLRYGVRADGRAAFPLMEFHNLSDEDLTAVISHLRSTAPQHRPGRSHEFNLPGTAVMAFAVTPKGPDGTRRR